MATYALSQQEKGDGILLMEAMASMDTGTLGGVDPTAEEVAAMQKLQTVPFLQDYILHARGGKLTKVAGGVSCMHSSPVKTVFGGDRASEFSNRFFARILQTPAELRGVMDSPPRSGVSTNSSRGDIGAGGAHDFFEYAKQAGIPARKPRNPNSAATCD